MRVNGSEGGSTKYRMYVGGWDMDGCAIGWE